MHVRTPCSSSTSIGRPSARSLSPRAHLVFGNRHGHLGGGSSNALSFNAAQFSDGRIVVLGHCGDDVAFRWFGGGDQSEPTGFTGVTSEEWTLTSEGNARSPNYLPKTT